jgi:hypothetical protein
MIMLILDVNTCVVILYGHLFLRSYQCFIEVEYKSLWDYKGIY